MEIISHEYTVSSAKITVLYESQSRRYKNFRRTANIKLVYQDCFEEDVPLHENILVKHAIIHDEMKLYELVAHVAGIEDIKSLFPGYIDGHDMEVNCEYDHSAYGDYERVTYGEYFLTDGKHEGAMCRDCKEPIASNLPTYDQPVSICKSLSKGITKACFNDGFVCNGCCTDHICSKPRSVRARRT